MRAVPFISEPADCSGKSVAAGKSVNSGRGDSGVADNAGGAERYGTVRIVNNRGAMGKNVRHLISGISEITRILPELVLRCIWNG